MVKLFRFAIYVHKLNVLDDLPLLSVNRFRAGSRRHLDCHRINEILLAKYFVKQPLEIGGLIIINRRKNYSVRCSKFLASFKREYIIDSQSE